MSPEEAVKSSEGRMKSRQSQSESTTKILHFFLFSSRSKEKVNNTSKILLKVLFVLKTEFFDFTFHLHYFFDSREGGE